MIGNRRAFMIRLSKVALALAAARFDHRAEAAGPIWSKRTATADDAADLATIFNAHTAAGICPYSDLVDTWTHEDAARYLATFNGSVLVTRDSTIVGFVGLIDYSNPLTTSQLAFGTEPEIGVLALHPERLSSSEMSLAAQHLAAGAARKLRSMGFRGCAMRIPAGAVFDSDDWFSRHMTVTKVQRRKGIDHAREVRFDAVRGLVDLEAAGF
jgi:hypothetical protein